MSEHADYELWVGDEMVASASGPRMSAWAEIVRYAAQYAEDGEVKVYSVLRRDITWWLNAAEAPE